VCWAIAFAAARVSVPREQRAGRAFPVELLHHKHLGRVGSISFLCMGDEPIRQGRKSRQPRVGSEMVGVVQPDRHDPGFLVDGLSPDDFVASSQAPDFRDALRPPRGGQTPGESSSSPALRWGSCNKKRVLRKLFRDR
jgi:hypothetical protein